jgi:hypothetical protein
MTVQGYLLRAVTTLAHGTFGLAPTIITWGTLQKLSRQIAFPLRAEEVTEETAVLHARVEPAPVALFTP